MRNVVFMLAVTASFLTGAYAQDKPIELPDSPTSSIGSEKEVKGSFFSVECVPAKEFLARKEVAKAKGIIIGTNVGDNTLVMVFKTGDGGYVFTRSDMDGKNLCIFGVVRKPDVNIGAMLGGSEL